MTNIQKGFAYYKYRWFITSNGKLVVGGKNAEQNEELIKKFIEPKHDLEYSSQISLKNYSKKEKYVVMHTRSPGSPFSIILDENPNEKDINETAIFTASFSRQWKSRKKEAQVDVFLLEQIYKEKNMKVGTFGVTGKIDHRKIPLILHLKKQLNVLRAVPFKSDNSLIIIPGKIPKEKFAMQISKDYKIDIQEVLNALPTGGFDFEIAILNKPNKEYNKTSKKKK